MNGPKFLRLSVAAILVFLFLTGCSAPAPTPTAFPTFAPPPPTPPSPPTPPPPPPTPVPPLAPIVVALASPPPSTPIPPLPTVSTGTSLFTLVKSVKVTPSGNLLRGAFVKIGYVSAKNRIAVTFNTNVSKPEGGCTNDAYAYKEYTTDMVETGSSGVISCHAKVDSGGAFIRDSFYLASMDPPSEHDGKEGLWLAKYDAATWKNQVGYFYPLAAGEDPGDAMVASVNGQIDISSTYRSPTSTVPWGPFSGAATHHQLFTTDLKFVGKRVLSDTPHINLSSMVTANGTINFVTGTSLLGNLIVMQYDSNWKYLGAKTLKVKSSAPEGLAFDGKRFYVSYLDVPCSGMPCDGNVRLAAFDSNWNLLDDIAVTSFSPQDHKGSARPTLALWNNRIYVGYDGWGDKPFVADADPAHADLQAFVKVYDVNQAP